MRLTVKAAYGRQPKTKEAVRAMWAENKDFQIVSASMPYNSGMYINKSDFETYGKEYDLEAILCRFGEGQYVVVAAREGYDPYAELPANIVGLLEKEV